jgi:probable addiction module antidote protein
MERHKRKKGKAASYEEGLLERLKDPEYATGYPNAVLKGGDNDEFLVALQHVAKAHGIAKVARRAHLGRESMYKALSGKTSPRLETVNRVLHAVGLKMAVLPGS